jgi:hypothetical protein
MTAEQPRSTPAATFAEHQRDMRLAWLGGAPGMLASSLAWAAAGCAAAWVSQLAVPAMFIFGMFIHPVGMVITRALGASARHSPGNPLGILAVTSTIWMILMLALAYGVALQQIELFFPAVLCVIGGRYLVFATIYGQRHYWTCGAVLALAGVCLANVNASPVLGAFTGAAIEALFGLFLLAEARREAGAQPTPA